MSETFEKIFVEPETKSCIFNTDNEIIAHLELSMQLACAGKSKLADQSLMSAGILNCFGMSGHLTRHLINNLANVNGLRYAEVGTYVGSTLFSALYGNNINAVCCDNWSQFNGPKEIFYRNAKSYFAYDSAAQSLEVFESDYADENIINNPKWKNIDFYLFDGPHDKQHQYDALIKYLGNLSQRFIFMVDDWHWKHVREQTMKAIEDSGVTLLKSIEIDVDEEKKNENGQVANRFQGSDWHNGIAVFTCRKNSLSE
jgi:hypothetical protein